MMKHDELQVRKHGIRPKPGFEMEQNQAQLTKT